MTRNAILIANSVTAQHTQEKTAPTLLRRTTAQISATLGGLHHQHAFDSKEFVDQPPTKVRQAIDTAAEHAAGTRDLLLIYYFGHGRIEQDDLVFVHPGQSRDKITYLPFQSVLHQVQVHNPPKVLFVLDCCYAGAAAKRFTSEEYCVMACTTPTTRALFEEDGGRPIGVFTRAFLDGITTQEATISITNDEISAESLFRYAKRQTSQLTAGTQDPYMVGKLDEPITIWAAAPTIVSGIALSPQKSGYAKLLAITLTLHRRRFEDVKQLYEAVLLRHREHFLTAYKDDDGRIGERPAHWSSLRRYVSFLRAIGIVDSDVIALTTTGSNLVSEPDVAYNSKLLPLLDQYLAIHRLDRASIRRTMQDLLQRRVLPTMQNIVTDLELTKRHRINQGHLSLILQTFGYMGAIGMPKSREQIFFPWTSNSRRQRAEAAGQTGVDLWQV